MKSGAKMFTFLDHDGVPWNNTNAEHAIEAVCEVSRAMSMRSIYGAILERVSRAGKRI